MTTRKLVGLVALITGSRIHNNGTKCYFEFNKRAQLLLRYIINLWWYGLMLMCVQYEKTIYFGLCLVVFINTEMYIPSRDLPVEKEKKITPNG